MCHPEFVRLLDDSFIELPNKQMWVGEKTQEKGRKERRGKEKEEIILTLKHQSCDYLLKK